MTEQAARSCRKPDKTAPRPAPLRLSADQIVELVRAYEVGASTYELATKYKIRRDMVTTHLRRAGIDVRPGPQVALDEAGERRAAMLYRDGLSMRSIATQMGVSDNTVLKALRAQGVSSRPRMGGVQRQS